MKTFFSFAYILIFSCLITIPMYSEPVFEKNYSTKREPETKIIRYRVISHENEKKGYALSFTGKIIRGKLLIQIEDTQKNIIAGREIPAFSLIHWQFLLSEELKLDDIYISLHFNQAVGSIYTAVSPTIDPNNIYISQITTALFPILLIVVYMYFAMKKKLPISWFAYGLLLGICGNIFFYTTDLFDFLPTKILIASSSVEEDISDFLFSAYIALRETAILFLLLGIFANKLISLKQDTKPSLSISIGITTIFLTISALTGLLNAFQLSTELGLSPHFLASASIQSSHTPLFYLFTPLKNLISGWLWFSSIYLVVLGTTTAEKRTVLHGILIFITTEAVLIYLNQSYFNCQYSSWWGTVTLIVISFFPLFLLVFRNSKTTP